MANATGGGTGGLHRARGPRTFAVLAAVLAATLGPAVAAGTAGTLDATFDGDGVATTTTSLGLNDVLVQQVGTTGRYVAVGAGPVHSGSGGGWGILAYTPTGALDASFGPNHDGFVPLFTNDPYAGGAMDAALDSSGRILAVGRSSVTTVVVGKGNKTTSQTTVYGTVVRLTTDGTPDPSFGSAGIVRLSLGGSSGLYPMGVVELSTHKVVVAMHETYSDKRGSYIRPVLACLNPDGTLYGGFGQGGFCYDAPQQSTSLSADMQVVVQSGDRIVVSHRDPAVSMWMLSRFTATGTLDTTFGSNGRVVEPTVGTLQRIVVDPANDSILAAGQKGGTLRTDRDLVFARYGANGSPDTTFGQGGYATVEYAAWSNTLTNGVALGTGGTIVFSVAVSDGTTSRPTVGRLLPNGTLDPDFGTGGFGPLLTVNDNSPEWRAEVAVAPEGVVLVGWVGSSSGAYIARFLSD